MYSPVRFRDADSGNCTSTMKKPLSSSGMKLVGMMVNSWYRRANRPMISPRLTNR